MKTELKPCPFCGSKEIDIWKNEHLEYIEYRVCCMNCHITQAGQYYYRERDAVDAWNWRANDES